MTLVPNRRLLSNGSKFLLAVLLLGSLSACELFKPISTDDRRDDRSQTEKPDDELDPIQSRRVYDPVTGTYVLVENAPTLAMDTIEWRVLSEERYPPIVEDGSGTYTPQPGTLVDDTNSNDIPITQVAQGENGSRKLSAYQISYILPFLANHYNEVDQEIDPNSMWALHFYSGAELAMDKLRSEGHQLRIYSQDSEANTNKVKEQVQANSFRQSQLVIGPYLGPNVTEVAEAARNAEQVVISPFSAAANLSQNNPNYVQVNPSLQTHLTEIMEHVLNTQAADKIYLVSGTSDTQIGLLGWLQQAYAALSGQLDQPLPTISLDATENIDMNSYLDARKIVFIMPEYQDEALVSNFLRQVYAYTRDGYTQVAVYGLPQWRNFNRIDLDYFEGTNVHISSSVHVDLLDTETREFRRDFYDRFGTLPREEAYLGYDVTLYFARMLRDHGTRFQYALEREAEPMLHTEFRFEPVYSTPEEGSLERPQIDRWENRYVHILRFQNYQFRAVN